MLSALGNILYYAQLYRLQLCQLMVLVTAAACAVPQLPSRSAVGDLPAYDPQGGALSNPKATSVSEANSEPNSAPNSDPDAERTSEVVFHINPLAHRRPISPYIYGTNFLAARGRDAFNLTLGRMGGYYLSTYNWETNAHNTSVFQEFANAAAMGGGDVPGEAIFAKVRRYHALGAAALITIPTFGWVAADVDGPVPDDAWKERFLPALPRKKVSFDATPDRHDGVVYQDELVYALKSQFPGSPERPHPIFFALDNEPGIWHVHFAPIRNTPLRYEELIANSIAYAQAIKTVLPDAVVFGPVNYGWDSFTDLVGAPDAEGRHFLDVYLAAMQRAEKATGRRLLDVLDIHWYPEVRVDGVRVTRHGEGAAFWDARAQAPRSLWEETYVEDSTITAALGGEPIRFLPRLMDKIRKLYPGTRLAISEYSFGGGDHITGALAQADALGIFGREGVFAACYWELNFSDSGASRLEDHRFAYGAMAMYRNFDGQGAAFGDTSIQATTSDGEATSIYASIDAQEPNRIVVVVINKKPYPIAGRFALDVHAGASYGRYTHALAYQLDATSASPHLVGALSAQDDRTWTHELAPWSVTVFLLKG